MCQFITATLPSTAVHSELDAIARTHGKQLRPLSSASIERQLKRDQQYFLTTLGHCDCGTVLGSYYQRQRHIADWAAEEHRLQKKGWSKAKIARALSQKQESAASTNKAIAEARANELASWRDFIADILQAGTSEFGLLLHHYRGRLDEEDIQLLGAEQIAAAHLTDEVLLRVREDVLYVFRRDK